jgi:hypothetical protein
MRQTTAALFARLRDDYVLGLLETDVFVPVNDELRRYEDMLEAELSKIPEDAVNSAERASLAEDLQLIRKAVRVLEFERERFSDMTRFLIGTDAVG